MSYLVFCSYEVGGLPFRMASILNQNGFRTYYVSIHKNAQGHDSTAFHYKADNADWDISWQFADCINSNELIVKKLARIKSEYKINGSLATGSKSFLLHLAGIDYHYWSFGADLDQICFYRKWPENCNFIKKIIFAVSMYGHNNRKAIQNIQSEQVVSITHSKSIMIAPYQVDSYFKICPDKPKFFFPHYFPQTNFNDIISQKKMSSSKINNKLGSARFFFSSSRHFWYGKNQLYSDNKANHIILHSFAQYLQLTADVGTKLVLIAKGPDVAATVGLARELNLVDKIVWLEEMKRNELQEYYSAAHVVFGQFGTPVLAFSSLEPLTAATPCISFFWDGSEQGVPFYKTSIPVFNTKDPVYIAQHLAYLMSDHVYYEKSCYEAWRWIQENCLEEHFSQALSAIFSAGNGFTDS